MMSAKTAIHGAMEAKADLADAINIVNRSLCKNNEAEMFVTAFAGVLEYRTGKLTYVNAGHNKPLIMRDGEWEWLTERSGPYLGSFDWVEYEKFETQLHLSDELFAYTDGVPFNPLEREDPVAPGSIEEAKIGGLGLLMTKKLMDDIEYVREGIANVTIITKSWE